ncbi:hypothetical protein PoB_005287900 [Plakobranchus ocellatus]|uniref:Uncharacterized protein n=1 Tax=Plakobranchus ocellatus TaxID=259542 RepID=A0AAV4C1H9_9GAST|nr:hypothetical protein PoB_005287900 [Plakobranchus ocellatus]
MWVLGGSVASELVLKSAKIFLSSVPVRHQSILDKGLEACDYLVVGRGFSVALKSAVASCRQFIPATTGLREEREGRS